MQFDLNANDRFAPASFPTVLVYNPDAAAARVRIDTSTIVARFGASAAVDLYETTGDAVVLRGAIAGAPVDVLVGPARAAVLVAVPANSTLRRDAVTGAVSVGSVVVRFPTPIATPKSPR